MKLRGVAILLVIGTCISAAQALTDLRAEVGWNGAYRNGHWAPIFVTASDPTPRLVEIEIYSSHDQIQAMRINQTVTIGPTPSTFALYAPLRGLSQQDLSITLYDKATRKRLATVNGENDFGLTVSRPLTPVDKLIGISGRGGENRMLVSQLWFGSHTMSAWLDAARLPAVPTGYDSISVLVLDRPDLTRLTAEQQEAIVNWVRCGGELLVWLNEDPPPASSPLLDVLPADVGDNISLSLSQGAVRSAGLQLRFAQQKARSLHARPDAKPIVLFGGEATAWRRRLGLGTITLLPVDPSTYLFNGTKDAQRFWQSVIETHVTEDKPNNYYNPYGDAASQARAGASSLIMDALGDVPGAGSFGFSYVAIVMIGLIFVVGPIDWIVLKKLDRHPWTWATTATWIALLTVGAIYMGHLFKSGDLHFRTMRLIDQADNMTIATTDCLGIYSPKTDDYRVKVDPEGWWEPMSADAYFYRRTGHADIDFHQDYHGTRAEPMRINVWNLRFLSSDTIATAPPIIDAKLRYENRAGKSFIAGTITNAGSKTITRLMVRARNGLFALPKVDLAPGATVPVDQELTIRDAALEMPLDSNEAEQVGGGHRLPSQTTNPELVNPAVSFRLAIDRSERINQILRSHNDMACIFAELAPGPSPATLEPAPNAEKHWEYLRALVNLEGSKP